MTTLRDRALLSVNSHFSDKPSSNRNPLVSNGADTSGWDSRRVAAVMRKWSPTTALSALYSSAKIREIERDMRGQRGL